MIYFFVSDLTLTTRRHFRDILKVAPLGLAPVAGRREEVIVYRVETGAAG